MSLEPGSCENLYCSHVLEHLALEDLRPTRPKGLSDWLKEWFWNSHHLWVWDYKGLAQELQDAGFTNQRRCEFGDAKNPAFEAVECRARYDAALAMECAKS